jgi:hypothetical protein
MAAQYVSSPYDSSFSGIEYFPDKTGLSINLLFEYVVFNILILCHQPILFNKNTMRNKILFSPFLYDKQNMIEALV